jgi:hypothetical protein
MFTLGRSSTSESELMSKLDRIETEVSDIKDGQNE